MFILLIQFCNIVAGNLGGWIILTWGGECWYENGLTTAKEKVTASLYPYKQPPGNSMSNLTFIACRLLPQRLLFEVNRDF